MHFYSRLPLENRDKISVTITVPIPRPFFRKIAAATAVVCDQLGGTVGRLDLMKILFASDRAMLESCGQTITGDSYCSLKRGPILSTTLNLTKDDYGGPLQKEWNEAFEKVDHRVELREGIEIDTSCLSDDEEHLIRQLAHELTAEKQKYMDKFGEQMGAVAWTEHLHEKWKEWSDPGNSSLPLPITDILSKGLGLEGDDMESVLEGERLSKSILRSSALGSKPIISKRR